MSNIAGRKPPSLVVGQMNWAPMWTLDGQRLVFMVSGSDRADEVYWRRTDGIGDAEHRIDTRSGEGWNANNSARRG